MVRNEYFGRFSVIVLFLLGCTAQLFGQFERTNPGTLSAGATVNYRYAESSELAITVTLLGAVSRPGRYEVSSKVDLLDLVALSGGWNETADMSDVQIVRSRTPGDSNNRYTIRLNLDNLGEVSPRFLELQDGDCILVGKTTPVTLPLVLSIVSTAATVAMAVAYFTVINR